MGGLALVLGIVEYTQREAAPIGTLCTSHHICEGFDPCVEDFEATYCTHRCGDDDDEPCPDGYKCAPVSEGKFVFFRRRINIVDGSVDPGVVDVCVRPLGAK